MQTPSNAHTSPSAEAATTWQPTVSGYSRRSLLGQGSYVPRLSTLVAEALRARAADFLLKVGIFAAGSTTRCVRSDDPRQPAAISSSSTIRQIRSRPVKQTVWSTSCNHSRVMLEGSVPFERLYSADLGLDRVYHGGVSGHAGDDAMGVSYLWAIKVASGSTGASAKAP